MQVIRSTEFERWITSESAKIQALVESRVFRIEHYDHFGDAKYLGDGLSELRWKNGLRVYFARTGARVVLLLHGGGKNEQKNDIKKAKILLERYTTSQA
ncbi:type II toxin-antitoxin system RelE/ParE family toxin [bacterium]|nr:type II toxin-antitoxin system RelE/ParE family toxin [bacterium]